MPRGAIATYLLGRIGRDETPTRPVGRRAVRRGASGVWFLLVTAGAFGADLTEAELADYRAALMSAPARVTDAGFRELWTTPEAHRGKAVRIAGRITRRFRQGPVDDLPALTETWLAEPSGNPLCLTYPTPGPGDAPLGAEVSFEGTFLKLVRYRAANGDRVAPLIVGARAPRQTQASGPAREPMPTPRRNDWPIAAALAVFAFGLLGLGMLRRPRRMRRSIDPPPHFEPAGAPDAS